MFETVVPELSVKPNRRVLYESLPFSIGIHAAAIAAVGFATLSQVGFPLQPPKLIVPYLLLAQAAATPPPPPPPLAAHPAVQHAAESAPPTSVLPTGPAEPQLFAPEEIPDTIPTPQAIAASISITSSGSGGESSGDGEPGGVTAAEGGVAGGVAGGAKNGVLGGVLLDDGRVHFDRDAVLPMMTTRYVHPVFPEMERINRQEGDVVVRYVIGKDGSVTSAKVIESSKVKAFDAAALEAINRWRFHPLRYGDDVLEVVHEVVVRFRLEVH